MIAILGGLGAALCFTVSALCASASSRAIGPAPTLAWVMVAGLILVIGPVAVLADPAQLSARVVALLVVAGLSNIAGLGIEYVALRRGKVGVVTAIVSTEGAIAAVISAIVGARLGLRTALLLGLITVGVVFTAAAPDDDDDRAPGKPRVSPAAVLAIAVAILFGISLYTTGRAGAEVSVLWVLVPARLFGTALVTAPLAATRTLRLTRRAVPLVTAAGAAEVLGTLSFAVGARHQLAIAAVLSAQFAALSAVGAYFIYGQRLSRRQLAGLVIVVAGVSLLSALGR